MSTPPQDNAWFNEVTKLISRVDKVEATDKAAAARGDQNITFLAKQVERLKKQMSDVFRTMCEAFTFNWTAKVMVPERHQALDQFPKLWGQPLNDAQSRLRMTDRQFRAQLSDRRQRQLAAVEAANAMTEDRTRGPVMRHEQSES